MLLKLIFHLLLMERVSAVCWFASDRKLRTTDEHIKTPKRKKKEKANSLFEWSLPLTEKATVALK